MTKKFQLNSDDSNVGTRNMMLNVLCVKNVECNFSWTPKKRRNLKRSAKNYNCKNEDILIRMPHDVFLHCICKQYLYPNEIFLLLRVSKNIYKILAFGSLNHDKYNDKSLLHEIVSKEQLSNHFCKLIDSLNEISDKQAILCKTREGENESDNYDKIIMINALREQIRIIISVCVSMVCWLTNGHDHDHSNVNGRTCTAGTNHEIKINKLLIRRHEKNWNEKLARIKIWEGNYIIARFAEFLFEEFIKYIYGLLEKVIEKMRILFVLTVSKLKFIKRNRDNCEHDRDDYDSCKIEIYLEKHVGSPLTFEWLFTSSIIDHMSSIYNYCQNSNINNNNNNNDMKLNRLVLKSNVKSIPIAKCIRLHFERDIITSWDNNNKAIIWNNHKYSYDYPMWNQYFVNVALKSNSDKRNSSAIDRLIVINNSKAAIKIDGYQNMKCLCLNKVFEKLELEVDGDTNIRLQHLVTSKGRNCSFLVVGIQ